MAYILESGKGCGKNLEQNKQDESTGMRFNFK